MELIDIGCNLTDESFDHDRDAVIEAARAQGVVQIIVTGASEDGSLKALELAKARPGSLYATAGIHPHRAVQMSADTLSVLAELHRHEYVVAVGECGLDYHRDLSPRPMQRKAFEKQLELAVDCGKPVFLHQRESHDDFLAILREFRPHLSAAVVHCFTDTHQALRDYLALDCHIGITGWICDERRGYHLKDFIGEIPSNRLMIETDSPYLKPRNLRPRVRSHRNEPRWLPWIAGTVAACRNTTPDQLAAQTTATAREFFRIGSAPQTA
ncbi:MAG TPA: TatD family hydrolase [Wenzhouxiangella sp.]|nr:TatD family hydrolase [Wenzhouxiangella sp.]